jgi:hypothetical protein
MKKLFYLFLILPFLAFSQVQKNNYDYFVQINTQQLAKKINMDTLFNHKAFKSFNKENSNTNLNDFMSFVDKTKPVTLHGSFTDSIPYYQITLPLTENKDIQQFIQRKIDQRKETDSIVESIKSHDTFQLYSPKNNSYTIAWNKTNLVLYGILDTNAYQPNPIDTTYYGNVVVDTTAIAVAYPVEETTTTENTNNPEETVVEYNPEQEDSSENYDDEYYQKLEEERKKEEELKRLEKQTKQEDQLAQLFQDGFVEPATDKVNTMADISAWMNYKFVTDKMSSLRYLYKFMPSTKITETEHRINSMNADFYFDNDKARIEQTVEYSDPLAKIVGKIISRKPNKNIFNYFPNESPLAYMSYHVNVEETLTNYPKLTEQALSSLPLEKQDLEIITDLFSTIIDEKATASLFDGDLSIFLHKLEQYSEKVTSTTYNEEYEEVIEEKMVNKSKPIFSFVMTSTHPTMVDKLLDLGLRKKGLVKENNYYVIKKSSTEFGSIVLLKDGDVFVITNGLQYLNNKIKSNFVTESKKQISKNYISGNLNIQSFIENMSKTEDKEKDKEKVTKASKQFKNIEFKSSKKLKNNKMKFEMEFNSNYSDKNIILQSLDLFSSLN